MILEGDLREEFLCTPELVRAVLTDDNQLALAIKAPLSQLKYLIATESISLTLVPLSDGCLAYILEIPDDPVHPAYVWSAVESENELASLQEIASGTLCGIYLFNEIAVNIAFTCVRLERRSGTVELETGAIRMSRYGEHDRTDEIDAGITQMKIRDPRVETLRAHRSEPWNHMESFYYSTGSGPSCLSVFDPNEGAQQEALGLWLTDTFAICGAYLNPNVASPNSPEKKRELCDILIAEDTHTFVIQSKVLSILTRPKLPTRARLHADTVKYVHDALRQAVGAARRLRQGHNITDTAGGEILVDRIQPMHLNRARPGPVVTNGHRQPRWAVLARHGHRDRVLCPHTRSDPAAQGGAVRHKARRWPDPAFKNHALRRVPHPPFPACLDDRHTAL